MARSISSAESLKEGGDQLSNLRDNSRTAVSLRSSTSMRICSTISRTLASAALIAVASIPRLRYRATYFSLLQRFPPVGDFDFNVNVCRSVGEPFVVDYFLRWPAPSHLWQSSPTKRASRPAQPHCGAIQGTERVD